MRASRIWTIAFLAILIALASCLPEPPPAKITSNVEDWRDEIIYQLITDRFNNGDINNDYNVDLSSMAQYHGGDWQGIIDRLDYLEELGITAIWISPVVKNVEEDAGVAGYHGYWTQDFLSTNPHFGSKAKLRELVERCHEHGIKVILDVVTNHVGQLFFYDINRNGKPDINIQGSGTNSELVRITEYDPDYDPRGIQSFTSLGEAGLAPIIWQNDPFTNHVAPMPVEFQNPNWYHRRGRVTDWNNQEQVMYGDFPGGLKDLKTEDPNVRKKLIEVFSYWIENFDIDGFRIDTVKHVEHGFWQTFCPAIREKAKSLGKKNFLMFGEIFDGNDQLIGSYTKNDELDSAFYFSQKFVVFDGVFKWGAPTKQIEDLYASRSTNYATIPHPNGIGVPATRALVNFIDNHDLPRFLFEKPDVRALRSALSFLLTTDGIPCIYYGTEQEFNGGNDPANREDLFASGFKTYGDTFQHIRKLIAIRKQYAPLRRGDLLFRWTTERTGDARDAGVVAFERTLGEESVLVVINAADATENAKFSYTSWIDDTTGTTYKMQVSFEPGVVLTDVLNDINASGDFADTEHEYTVEPNPDYPQNSQLPGLLDVKICRRCTKILVKKQ